MGEPLDLLGRPRRGWRDRRSDLQRLPDREGRHRLNSAGAARGAATPRAEPRLPAALLDALVAVSTLWAFRGALRYGFSQDDVAGLARAMGLAPRLSGPLRYLSHQAYFDLMRMIAGLNPFPYHVASLFAHAACAVLLHRLLRRWLSPPAAGFGALLYGAHPALFHAGYWIIAIGDSLALFFGLLAIRATLATGARRWLAVPLFAISLLCKESTIALPLAAVALAALEHERHPGTPNRMALRDPVILALLGLGTGLAFLFATSRAAGTGGLSYPAGVGPQVFDNGLTYLGWTAQVAPRGFTDAVDRAAWPFGMALLLVWLAGLAIPRLRRAGWLAGGLVYGALLLPVLPLRDHTYHYYLTAPLIGAMLCAGALVDCVAGALARPRGDARSTLLLAVVLSSAFCGFLDPVCTHAIQAIETHPFLDPGSRADPIVDRALILERAIGDLRAAALPEGVTLRFWSPVGRQRQRATHPEAPDAESYWERNVRTALLDGLAARVFVPAVREADFARDFSPAPPDVRFAIYLPDGHLHVATGAEVEAGLAHFPGAR